ncbi:hypothetical protein HK105_208357 [Polyrhizophydium stewartii]|uniref:Phospholipid/glycerol acyltransferase domain-containing protein n=1 Tax=Polyrhizophydium stewartii TaxID=2732419 RepID=A0ABR4MY17_9FUNG|nr:hypothetical protein HK105_001479 [Polyrhizophydium stewartii]
MATAAPKKRAPGPPAAVAAHAATTGTPRPSAAALKAARAGQTGGGGKPLRFYINAVLFLWAMTACSLAINWVQLVALPLSLVSRRHYRRWMRFTQRLFGSLMLTVTYVFAPLEIVMTGDHEGLTGDSVAVIMANHQIYTDWWYIWLFAWFRNAHGEIKIMLKDSLAKLPIFGWGMQFFEFIFMARKWGKDKQTLTSNLARARDDKMPLWLLIFPEGTVITDDTKAKSRAYAKKADLPDDPTHVLIPKSTGLLNSLRVMGSDVEYLYDFTIGYSGIGPDACPYDAYPLTSVFFEGKGPAQIHIHVDRFKVADLPGVRRAADDGDIVTPGAARAKAQARSNGSSSSSSNSGSNGADADTNPEFALWLRQRFLEKDEMLKAFYERGRFPELSRDGTGITQALTISPHVQDWITLAGLLVGSVLSSLYLLF